MASILILGAGMMASALCAPIADRGHQITLVGTHLDDDIITALKSTGYHPTLKAQLPPGIEYRHFAAFDAKRAKFDALIIGVSSAGILWAAGQLAQIGHCSFPLLMIAKGLHLAGGELQILPDQLTAALPQELRQGIQPTAVAGPCIAGELANRVPTCVLLGSRHPSKLDYWQAQLATDYYHLQVTQDLLGIEVCAALKNAYAMGIAFAAGIHEAKGGSAGSVAMHNYEAAVFAQASLEMYQLLRLLGGKESSAIGFAGVGDLNVTCNGGRTGRFGKLLGSGLGLAESIRRMQGATLECLEILEVMRNARTSLLQAGLLQATQLPLLQQLISVALEDAPVNMPFSQFGEGTGDSATTSH